MGEWATFWRDPDLGGIELLHASFVTHTYGKHAHDTFALGVLESGAQSFQYRGARRNLFPGDIVLINPGEVHTGQSEHPDGYVYRMLYPAPELVERATTELSGGRRDLPFFPEPVVRDEALAGVLRRVHRGLESMAPRLERESLLLTLLAAIVARHAAPAPVPAPTVHEPWAVARAREYLESCYERNVSLAELAGVAGLSQFHLVRVFQATVGISPHAYLDQVRVARAKELLTAGLPIAHVAAATGFADQSHLTRRFKRLVGVTPGRYQTASKNRQDGSRHTGYRGDEPPAALMR